MHSLTSPFFPPTHTNSSVCSGYITSSSSSRGRLCQQLDVFAGCSSIHTLNRVMKDAKEWMFVFLCVVTMNTHTLSRPQVVCGYMYDCQMFTFYLSLTLQQEKTPLQHFFTSRFCLPPGQRLRPACVKHPCSAPGGQLYF